MEDGPKQFDLCQIRKNRLVVVVQSDLIAGISSRVVVPMVPKGTYQPVYRYLNPEIAFGEQQLVLISQMMSAMLVSDLRTVVGNLAGSRDAITRALDMLIGGV